MKVPASLKRTLRISFSTLVAAGLTYWYARSWMRVAGEFGETPHWLEKLVGPIHFVAALVFLVVLGIVWSQHVRLAIRAHLHRWTGWAFVAVTAGLVLTATGLLYLGGDRALRVLSLAHPILGASLVPILIVHWRFRRA